MTDAYPGQFFSFGNDRERRCIHPRGLLMLTLSGLPVIVFCGIYLIILNTDQRLLYPKCCDFKVPYFWLERAKIYNDNTTANSSSYLSNEIVIEKQYRHNNNIIEEDELVQTLDEFKLVCYYNFPNNDLGVLEPETIDPFLCTHINIGFVSVLNNLLYITESQLKVIQQIVNFKMLNPKLKVLVSVGGAGNDIGFPEMVLNHINRKTFIRSVLHFVKLYKIDGIDLDWEFPNRLPNNDKYQRTHFTQLLEEFRNTIKKQIKHKFLLTLAVAAPSFIVDTSYDVPYINQFVDFINLMSYDYHFYTKLTPFTGLNSPLYPANGDFGYFSNLNINYSAHYWNSKGIDKNKIIIGLPTYGHSFRLINSDNNGLYAPSRGYGNLGYLGFVDFGQVCKFLEMNRITPVFDLEAKSPYATKSLEWISFDNEQSLSFKAEYIRDQQFGGAMMYSLNTDDHKGICQFDKRIPAVTFSLTRKVHEVLSTNYSIF